MDEDVGVVLDREFGVVDVVTVGGRTSVNMVDLTSVVSIVDLTIELDDVTGSTMIDSESAIVPNISDDWKLE